VILGAAARYLHDGTGRALSRWIDSPSAFELLAKAATGRLQKGLTLIQAGTIASGLVPQPGLSRGLRAAFAAVLVVALAGAGLAVAHGYQTPQVPTLPHPPGLLARR
jgi:hypothetical protein